MAAVLKHFERPIGPGHPPSELKHRAVFAPRVAMDLVDRRAFADVMAVMDSTQASDEEIWMISYMDIMTLLLTLFVLLLAFAKMAPQSQPDSEVPPVVIQTPQKTVPPPRAVVKPRPEKTVAIKNDQGVRHDLPATRQSAPIIMKATDAALPQVRQEWTPALPAQINPLANKEFSVVPLLTAGASAQDVIPPLAAPVTSTIEKVRETFLDTLRTGGLSERIEVTSTADSINLEISDTILFDVGSETLKAEGAQLLDELAGLLAGQAYPVSVEGHSDNKPVRTARFASNWELSASRATTVTRYLITKGIAAGRLRAIGYADTHPRDDNSSAQGRAHNRRVSLVLQLPVTPQTGRGH